MIKLFTDDNFQYLKNCVEKEIEVVKQTVDKKHHPWYYNLMGNCEQTLKDRITMIENDLNTLLLTPNRFEIVGKKSKGLLYKESNFSNNNLTSVFHVVLNQNLDMQILLKDSFLLFCLSENHNFKFIDTKMDVFSKNITKYLNESKNLQHILQYADKEAFKNYREALIVFKKIVSNCAKHLRYNNVDDFTIQHYGKIHYKNLKTFIQDLKDKTELLILSDYEVLASSNIDILKKYQHDYTIKTENKNE